MTKFKDISTLTNRPGILGDERIPVSGSEFVTLQQIASFSGYTLHTRRINDKLTHSYQLDTVIEGATAAELAAMGDTSQYRLVLMRLRKSPKQGRSWHIPMLPYERAKRPGVLPYTGAIAEGDTWWAVTGRIVPWWGGAKSLEEVLPLTTRIRKERRIFRNTRNVKMQVGVALFRRTDYGGEGWERISDIARIELYVPKSEASAIQINII